MTEISPDEQARRGLIGQIFAADRGKKASEESMAAYLHALRRMDTPRLARVVERILDAFEYGDVEPYRIPQPGRIWQVAKELRLGATPKPAPPLELHGAPEQKGDGWDLNANTLLLNYLTLGLVQKSIYGEKGSRDASRYAPPAHTAIMVRWKLAWARDMREDRELYDGKRDGKPLWADYMARAEGEIDALIALEREAA